jgi:hypothetical protein
MNTYRIEHKIKTLANLWDDTFVHDGFKFRQWEFSLSTGSHGEAWVAEKTIHASDVNSAINSFREDLAPIVERIAVASQCYATFGAEPYLMLKILKTS